MPLKHSRLIKLFAVLTSSLSLAFAMPSLAQSGENETKWRESINSDLRNGAPAEYICINAKSSAFASNDANFKDWAWSIARKYCPPGTMGKPSNEGIDTPKANPSNNGTKPQRVERTDCRMMSSVDAEKARKGGYVNLSSGGCVMIFNPLR